MTKDIASILQSSDAALSLGAEGHVFAAFQKRGWETAQGVMYLDAATKKYRELDILSQRLWRHPTKAHHGITTVRFLVEVKSLGGYHLLLPRASVDSVLTIATRFWLGDKDRGRYRWLLSALEREGFTIEQCVELVQDFGSSLFPDVKRSPRASAIEPPPIRSTATSFRETNTKITKDLDASVLWRATASLRSVVRSCFNKEMSINREFIGQAAFFAGADPAKRFEEVRKSLRRQALRVTEHHPVVVSDAQMWEVNGKTLTNLDWCRLVQRDAVGDVVFWCDVVHSDSLSRYVDYCTQYYDRSMRKRRFVKLL
ncbi:MAG: hypothetical protein AB7N73_05665 [Gemmatimonadales bacterium]